MLTSKELNFTKKKKILPSMEHSLNYGINVSNDLTLIYKY